MFATNVTIIWSKHKKKFYYYMINKSDSCIKGLTVLFITKQHVIIVNFSLISDYDKLFDAFHDTSVTNRSLCYIWIHLCLCAIWTATIFFYIFIFYFLSMIHHKTPVAQSNDAQVFTLAVPGLSLFVVCNSIWIGHFCLSFVPN